MNYAKNECFDRLQLVSQIFFGEGAIESFCRSRVVVGKVTAQSGHRVPLLVEEREWGGRRELGLNVFGSCGERQAPSSTIS